MAIHAKMVRCVQPLSKELGSLEEGHIPGLCVGDFLCRATKQIWPGREGFLFTPTTYEWSFISFPIILGGKPDTVRKQIVTFGGNILSIGKDPEPFAFTLAGAQLRPLFPSHQQMMNQLFRAYDTKDTKPIRLTSCKYEHRDHVFYLMNFEFMKAAK